MDRKIKLLKLIDEKRSYETEKDNYLRKRIMFVLLEKTNLSVVDIIKYSNMIMNKLKFDVTYDDEIEKVISDLLKFFVKK